MFNSLWKFVKSTGFMAVVALVSFVVAIYTSFYYEKQGNLSIELMQPTKVLDIHQAVGGLTISYGGEELRTAKKNLWLINVTLKNNGNAVIRKSDFDNSSLLSINISDGSIVEKPTLLTESNYLKENLKPRVEGSSLVFNPVIIEPDDKFSVSFFVLGNENSSPIVSSDGKIAGIKNVHIIEMSGDSKDESFWSNVFSTNKWWYQIVRAFSYGFLSIILMALFAICISVPGDFFETRRSKRDKAFRRDETNKYKPDEPISIQRKALLEFYIDGGVSKLAEVDACFKIFENRKDLYFKLKNNGLRDNDKLIHMIIISMSPLQSHLSITYNEMRKRKIIPKNYDSEDVFVDEFKSITECFEINIDEFNKKKFPPLRDRERELKYRNIALRSDLDRSNDT